MKIRQLSKSYGASRVVDEVSLEIPEKQVTAFIGPNGAGKSTVLSIMSRLLAKEEGEVIFKGKALDQWKSRDLAKELAVLSQSNITQLNLRVEELVAFGRFPHSGGRLTQEDQQKIDQALAYMDLEDLRHRFMDQLSGGQQQRAYIAMILAQDTDYILLDEPNNNLDIRHATNLMKILRRLCDELGKTIIVVLHDINYAAFYADYVCAFKAGKLVKAGPVNQVMTKENLSAIYEVDFDMIDIKGKPLSIYY